MKTLFKPVFWLAVALLATLPISSSFAVNILSVQDPQQYGSLPGYIDDATLVVEPHGGYVEQSLYLSYSDHAQYPTDTKVEIVHRFELPPGSVINDLWLWIADSVMQAIMMDTWTARAIYDSIVSHKRDPAFLTKIGEQYELHVYPLTPGNFRKVKINFITPTRWLAEKASAALPLPMLQANSAAAKPLNILFRVPEDVWGEPSISEFPDCRFSALKDTLYYRYRSCRIPDISQAASLTLNFATQFENGFFYQCYKKPDEMSYFQVGIMPRLFYGLAADSTTHRYLVGLDVSGTLEYDLAALLPPLESVIASAMMPNDRFKLLAAGGGKIQEYLQDWMPADSASVKAAMQEFQQSDLAKSLELQQKPHILYCDPHAAQCWRFQGLDRLATYQVGEYIQSSTPLFRYADIIAAYNHGYEDVLNDEQLRLITTALDTFFTKGGRLLSFYDYNRVNNEKLASFYIPGLTTKQKIDGMLYRNPQGNIGINFPESIYCPVVNKLEYQDASVRVELMDAQGNPAVISKKIKNGLLVVSGIWSFGDDDALRVQLGIPLLGLTSISEYQQLPQLLSEVKTRHQAESFDRVLIFSNSDSLFLQADAEEWTSSFVQDFSGTAPAFNTVTLLEGKWYTPPMLTYENRQYFGSGYLLNVLSERTNGLHFERHTDSWEYIAASLSPTAVPQRKELELEITVDHGAGECLEKREVNPIVNDANKPIFFIGSANGDELLQFDFQASFRSTDTTIHKQIEAPINADSLTPGKIIPAMLAFEDLRDLLNNAAYDTAAIVQLAIKYNLLCDYTALLCLEPNDTLHFIKNPLIEDGWASRVVQDEAETDSLSLSVYPNPFNDRTVLSVNLPQPGEISLIIYNIRGQRVRELARSEAIMGRRTWFWEGRNEAGLAVGSGIYFVHASIRFENSKQQRTLLRRILLLR